MNTQVQKSRPAAVFGSMVCQTGPESLHAGMFYTFQGKQLCLHLGSQDKLSRNWQWQSLWVVPNIDPVQAINAAALCELIWNNYLETRLFDYGIHWNGSSIDESGRQVLADGAAGMSCSSLVLSVLNTVGVELTDMNGWPVRTVDDLARVEGLSWMGDAVVERMLGEVVKGAMRVRPEEMFAACELYPPSSSFERLEQRARQIEEQLHLGP